MLSQQAGIVLISLYTHLTYWKIPPLIHTVHCRHEIGQLKIDYLRNWICNLQTRSLKKSLKKTTFCLCDVINQQRVHLQRVMHSLNLGFWKIQKNSCIRNFVFVNADGFSNSTWCLLTVLKVFGGGPKVLEVCRSIGCYKICCRCLFWRLF